MARTNTAAAVTGPHAWAPGQRSIHQPIPLGIYEDGSPADVAVWNTVGGRNLFVVGAMGSGKTNLLNVLLAGLFSARDTIVFGADVAKSGKSLAPWISCFDWFVTTPEDTLTMVRVVNRIIGARSLEGARLAATGRGDAVLQPSAKLPLIVCVFDEVAAMLGRTTDVAADITEEVTQAAETVREVALAMILSTQKPTQDSLGHSGRLKSQLNPVLAGRMNRLSDLRWALTNAPAESLDLGVFTAPGVLLMQDGADSSPLPVRSFALYEPADVVRLAALYAPHRPQLDAVSRLAAGSEYAHRNRDPFGLNTPTTAPGQQITAPPAATGTRPAPAPAKPSSKDAVAAARAQAAAAMAELENLPPLPAAPLTNLIALHDSPPLDTDPDTVSAALAALTDAGQPMSREQIQHTIKVSRATACRSLAALLTDQKITRVRVDGQLRYRPAHTP